MRTYPIAAPHDASRSIAFEIDNTYASTKTIGRLLGGVKGVGAVAVRKMFKKPSDVHVEFRYADQDYVVWEPFGDSSRYWIGPRNVTAQAPDIRDIENAFKEYRPPVVRKVLGDILSFKFLSRPTTRG